MNTSLGLSRPALGPYQPKVNTSLGLYQHWVYLYQLWVYPYQHWLYPYQASLWYEDHERIAHRPAQWLRRHVSCVLPQASCPQP